MFAPPNSKGVSENLYSGMLGIPPALLTHSFSPSNRANCIYTFLHPLDLDIKRSQSCSNASCIQREREGP